MKKISSKQSIENRLLSKVYKTIAEDRGHYCTGCGRADLALSHSHIIPRSRRKDLVLDPDNITYHCLGDTTRQGCHELWESNLNDKQRLLDYHKSMEYILQKDAEYYFLLTEFNKL
tara:strand:+ start:2488 stop:2835 length:348 start_codon:yes stop_codon:yes gene_type:complete